MNKQENLYAYFYRDWYNKGLKPVELLIIMEINSYINNGRECYMTNKQFADLFNVCEKTISTTMDELEKKGFIKRNTNLVSDRGQHTKFRTITLTNKVSRGNKETQTKETTKQSRLNNDFSF